MSNLWSNLNLNAISSGFKVAKDTWYNRVLEFFEKGDPVGTVTAEWSATEPKPEPAVYEAYKATDDLVKTKDNTILFVVGGVVFVVVMMLAMVRK